MVVIVLMVVVVVIVLVVVMVVCFALLLLSGCRVIALKRTRYSEFIIINFPSLVYWLSVHPNHSLFKTFDGLTMAVLIACELTVKKAINMAVMAVQRNIFQSIEIL